MENEEMLEQTNETENDETLTFLLRPFFLPFKVR